MAKSFDDLIKDTSEPPTKKSKVNMLLGSKTDIIRFAVYIVLFGLAFGILIMFLFGVSNHPAHVLLRGEEGDESTGMHGPSDFIEIINNPINLLQSV
jgi:hypothetical protein